jgi:hypothetical protein
VRRSILAPVLVLVFAPCLAATSPTEEQAARAAVQLGMALKSEDASYLRPILPERGKVQLHLFRLGPEQGYFSSDQVEVLLLDFTKRGSLRSFDVLRIEHEPERLALVHGRASIRDRQGHSARVELHLAFEPEDGRWVLREIRETPP